jgi:hypothetical protein
MAGVAAVAQAPPPPVVAPSIAAANARPAGTLDPQLFMAACCGDNNRLKELLGLDDDGRVIVQVEAPPAAAPSSSSGGAAASGSRHHQRLLQLDAVTGNEGDSLLHVVAARGGDGGRRFLDCAKTIYRGNNGLLVARNNKGNTPLHCAAGAGSGAGMVSCLVALKTAEASAGADEAAVREFVRVRNVCGETALHQAVHAACMACVDELLRVDPSLAAVPREGEEGASPFYLAISLGRMDIARHLLDKSNGELSYSGLDGQNVLHAAVSRGQGTCVLLPPSQINYHFDFSKYIIFIMCADISISKCITKEMYCKKSKRQVICNEGSNG